MRFAAGLAGKAVHEYRELIGWENGWLVQPAWDIKNGMWASGTFYDFMKGFFGWHAETEKIRLIAYFGYLIPVMWLFLKKPSTKSVEQSSSESVSV